MRRLLALGALLCVATLMVVVASARAGCGGVEQENPRRDVTLGRAPLAIGDSPMLLALPNLANKGYRANAHGCRQWAEGLGVIRKFESEDRLPRLVVIALGSNGVITKGDIREALDLVGKKRTLGLVTPRESGGGSSNDADVIREAADDHANRIVLLDWVRYSSGHASWFQPDGLHLTYEGAAAFAKLLSKPLKDLPKPH